MDINVISSNANNIVCSVTPTPQEVITIDRGVAGVGISSIVPVMIGGQEYLQITYTNGVVSNVGPLASSVYFGTSPIVVTGNTISLSTVPVSLGGTGATTLTGYLSGNGTGAFTASTTIPNTAITGLGTMSTQNAGTVAITGGTINGASIGATTRSSGDFTTLSGNTVTNTTPVLSFNASNTIASFGSTTANSYNQLLIQNKSTSTNASSNYVISNDQGTDSSYYGEFGMNSSVFSSGTPSDFYSINNGVYFSGHDGDITFGSGNGYKSYFAWGSSGQNAHVINNAGAIGLSTNLGTTPALSGTTGYGTTGQVLTSNGAAAAPTWTTVISTSFSAGTTGFTPNTATSGAITLAGTLATTNGGTGLTSFTAKGVVYASSTSALTTGSALTFDGTNLGIGTSSPATTLDITSANTNVANFNGTSTNGTAIKLQNSGTNTFLIGSSKYLTGGSASEYGIGTLGATPIIFVTNGSERARFDSSGNLGIGTTGPSTKLQVIGTSGSLIDAAGSGAAGLQNLLSLRTGIGNSYGFQIKGNYTSEDYLIQNYYSGYLAFGTNNTERARIDSSGNVGIGTSSFDANWSPKLQVTSTASDGTGGILIESYRPSLIFKDDSASAVRQHIVADNSTLMFGSGDASFTERMRIDSSGNVGIGTTSPSASAILDAQSTTKGVRMPNMTTTQKNAIASPAAGLMVFDTTLAKLCVYSGSAWQTITSI